MSMRSLVGSVLASLALVAASSSRAADPFAIRWTVSEAAPDQVFLRLNTWSDRDRSTSSVALPRAALQGLPDLSKAGPVHFSLLREAGRIDCDGHLADRRGSGDCRFTADTAFAAALERRGVDRPTARQQFEMTARDLRLGLVDELERQGYRRPTARDLVAAAIFRIDVAWLKSLDAVGYRAGSVGKLVAFRIFRVEPEWIGELATLGPRFRDLPPDRLVAMRIHRVTPEFARRMLAERPDLTPARLIELRIFGGRPPPGWRDR